MGLYERAKEILAVAYYCNARASREHDCLDSGIGGRAVYLYFVLELPSKALHPSRVAKNTEERHSGSIALSVTLYVQSRLCNYAA